MARKAIATVLTLSVVSALVSIPSQAVDSNSTQPQATTFSPTLVNAAPESTASFSKAQIDQIASNSDSSVLAYLETGKTALSIKTAREGEAKYEELFNESWCAPSVSPFSQEFKNLQVSENGLLITFLSKSDRVQCSGNIEPRTPGKWIAYSLKRENINSKWELSLISTSTGSANVAEATGLSSSADGSRVAFISSSDTLFPGDSNRSSDVFVKNLKTDATTLVSLGAGGWQANAKVDQVFMSQDGRYVSWNAIYNDGDSQVYPENTSAVSNIMLADIGDAQNNITDNLRVKKVPLDVGTTLDSSLKQATLLGFVNVNGEPEVVFKRPNSNVLHFHSIENDLNYSVAMESGGAISSDGKSLWDRAYLYSLDSAQRQVTANNINTSYEIVRSVNDDRIYTNTQYQGSYESRINKDAELAPFNKNLKNLESFGWNSANPRNIIPTEVDRGKLNEQVVWLTALSGQLGKTIHQRKYDRRDEGVTKPSSTINESSVEAERRSTIDDIDDLQTLKEETDAVLAGAKEKKDLIDSILIANACKQPGQWCGATKAAATSGITYVIVDFIVSKIVGRFPAVQAFDLAYNSVNGSCPGPLEQISNYSAAGAAQTHILGIRILGEAASWPVTQNILEDHYGIDRPGCWDQVGLDSETLLDAVGGFAEGLDGKWKGLGVSITAVQMSVDAM